MNKVEKTESREDLKKENKKLQLINQIFRHDIRNDINVVKLNAEELQKEFGEHKKLETIINKMDHMYELTILARDIAESIGKDTIKPIDVHAILKKCIKNLRKSYPESKIDVDGKIPQVDVKADKLLPSMFENIIQNGIQHNDKQTPKITVSTDVSDDTVLISIRDNGSGIPDDMKEKIFNIGEKSPESSGTGLGLFLVDTLASNYNGDIWIEDNQPEGTIFKIKLQKA